MSLRSPRTARPARPQVFSAHRLHGGAVVAVVAGREQIVGEHRESQAALAQAVIGAAQLLGAAGEDEHGLAEHREIAIAGRILVRLADGVGIGPGHAAHQKGGDVQLLPDGEIVPQGHRDLRPE